MHYPVWPCIIKESPSRHSERSRGILSVCRTRPSRFFDKLRMTLDVSAGVTKSGLLRSPLNRLDIRSCV